MAMREGETLKTYFDRYCELFNEIDEDFEDVAVRTFKVRPPMNHDLRKSLTMKPAQNVCQLMDRIDKHKRVEEDQVQGKRKAKVFTPEKRDPRPNKYGLNRPRRDFFSQLPRANTSVVSSVFKEPIYRILEKIKNEPHFKWPNKMGGDLTKWNQSLYCHYHQDWRHTTKDYKTLRDYLEQLVKERKLKQFMHKSLGQGSQTEQGYQRKVIPRSPLGTISITLVMPNREASSSSRIMSIALQPELEEQVKGSKRTKA
ncbi:uncharacterized protein LOC112000451 [Quercus suber]|uniref:uncharacterized protein LOC112000451 n=1 Tax=Quercus suber TaxID=58331 RepID=UPI000CE16CBF|nr:uncharacterized protein LOC112000451 [Quercus suber]